MSTLEEVLAGISDERTLRNKRGARKGNLKQQSKHCHSVADLPLSRLNVPDLKKRLETVEENITAFELIQDRLEEVTESDALVNKEADTMAQRKTHSDLVEAYQGLIRAGQAWITGECLKDEVRTWKVVRTFQAITHGLPTSNSLPISKTSVRTLSESLTGSSCVRSRTSWDLC